MFFITYVGIVYNKNYTFRPKISDTSSTNLDIHMFRFIANIYFGTKRAYMYKNQIIL